MLDSVSNANDHFAPSMTDGATLAAPAALPPTDHARISVVIVARNEAQNLPWVLERLTWFSGDRLLVDGHSTDGTAAIARDAGWRVVVDDGTGKGDALRRGALEARGDIVVFIDADGSHDAADIPRLVAPILRAEADLVLGSRMRGGSDELFASVRELVRMFGSAIITIAINYRFGLRLTDYQNGFRAIRRDVMNTLGTREQIFTIEQEMAIKAIRAGHRVTEVPTHEYRRRAGQSHIVVWRVSWRYVWCLLRNLW